MRPQQQVVFEGQSLLNIPFQYPIPWHIGEALTEPTAIRCGAISGTTMASRSATVAQRIDQHTFSYDHNVCVLMQCQTEVQSGTAPATINAAQEAYATARLTAGFDTVVVFTVPAIDSSYLEPDSATKMANRVTLNGLTVASSTYDAVVDLSDDAGFENLSSGYFIDGLHLSNAGALAAANMLLPVLAQFGVV